MADKLSEMTLEALEKRINDLDEQRMGIREQMAAVRREIDKRLAERSAREKLERLSDAERMALLQMIDSAGGIESAAKIDGLAGIAPRK